jgi:hypothetical protein
LYAGNSNDDAKLSNIIAKSTYVYGTGYIGDFNFCLRATDTALSGPSRSKVLNEVTNTVFKALVIGMKFRCR